MSYVTCHCKHSKDSHESGSLSCTLCECTLYRPITTDDPFKNSVQQKTVRLLAFARESDYAKTRRLGAKIEELLGELELISEQEQIMKAELARQEKEREKAEKDLEAARNLLAQAEEAMRKFAPSVKPKRSVDRYSSTKRKTCPICGQQDIINLGAHSYQKHPETRTEN